MTIQSLVEKYAATKVCKNGQCFEVGNKEYKRRALEIVESFELEQDFLTNETAINIFK